MPKSRPDQTPAVSCGDLTSVKNKGDGTEDKEKSYVSGQTAFLLSCLCYKCELEVEGLHLNLKSLG